MECFGCLFLPLFVSSTSNNVAAFFFFILLFQHLDLNLEETPFVLPLSFCTSPFPSTFVISHFFNRALHKIICNVAHWVSNEHVQLLWILIAWLLLTLLIFELISAATSSSSTVTQNQKNIDIFVKTASHFGSRPILSQDTWQCYQFSEPGQSQC